MISKRMREMADLEEHAEGSRRESLPVEFKFENHAVRTVSKDGEIWFIADDVCKVLEHSNSRKAIERLDDDEKGVTKTYTPGGSQDMNIINEFGLYGLILTSRKPEAKSFKRWVIHEVLPAIRKTGRYEAGQPDEELGDGFDAEHAHRRFKEIYSHDFVNPDSLLQMLFGENIPFTGDAKFRFFGISVCEALGIVDKDATLDLLPESQKTVLQVFTPRGTQQLPAITEAALYLLAFHRNAIALRISSKKDTIQKSDLDQLNCLALCYSLKTIEALWCKFEHEFLANHPKEGDLLLEIDKQILSAVETANSFLHLYGEPALTPGAGKQPRVVKH
jgi:prophage antirepressor-like protein